MGRCEIENSDSVHLRMDLVRGYGCDNVQDRLNRIRRYAVFKFCDSSCGSISGRRLMTENEIGRRMVDRQYRCPVCGAPIEGEKCEYCGCVIYDFATISTDEPRYIRLAITDPISGQKALLQMKAIAVNPNVEIITEDVQATDWAGNRIKTFTTNQSCTMKVEFKAVQDNDALFTLTMYDKPYRESWRDDIDG